MTASQPCNTVASYSEDRPCLVRSGPHLLRIQRGNPAGSVGALSPLQQRERENELCLNEVFHITKKQQQKNMLTGNCHSACCLTL